MFDFFGQFVAEAIVVRDIGLIVGDRRIFLVVYCYIADAPVRAMSLNHCGHNSRMACSKCKVEGYHYMGRMIFVGTGHELRTDEEYRNMIDEDHHFGSTPLSDLLGLLTKVPFEGLHSVWSGNVKKALTGLIGGKYNP